MVTLFYLLLLIPMKGDGGFPTWLAPTVISSGIAGAVALATHFSSQKAKKVESREDIRTEAYEQAKAFYTDVIDRQDRELTEVRGQVSELLRRVGEAEAMAQTAKAAVRRLTEELTDREVAIAQRDAQIAKLTA